MNPNLAQGAESVAWSSFVRELSLSILEFADERFFFWLLGGKFLLFFGTFFFFFWGSLRIIFSAVFDVGGGRRVFLGGRLVGARFFCCEVWWEEVVVVVEDEQSSCFAFGCRCVVVFASIKRVRRWGRRRRRRTWCGAFTVSVSLRMRRCWYSTRRPSTSSVTCVTRSSLPLEAWSFTFSKCTRSPFRSSFLFPPPPPNPPTHRPICSVFFFDLHDATSYSSWSAFQISDGIPDEECQWCHPKFYLHLLRNPNSTSSESRP